MFNSYGLMDRILTGDGNSSRIFLTIDELILALNDSGIKSDMLTDHLKSLEAGLSFEIKVRRIEANPGTMLHFGETLGQAQPDRALWPTCRPRFSSNAL